MVIFGASAFLGVVSACACNWYPAAFSTSSRGLGMRLGHPVVGHLCQPILFMLKLALFEWGKIIETENQLGPRRETIESNPHLLQ